jgi:prepilin-type N-terminal cleavage/methylation domain-containing protein/prepilin-type processing-associated H-X9-DG protein
MFTSFASRRSRPTRAAGFTLIELLVVVAIIALLLAILLPSLRSAREQAKMVKCLANMRSNGQAAMVFNSERGVFQLVTDEVGVAAADPGRSKYEYDGEELLSWPVALSQAAGFSYRANWNWGVRALSFDQAKAKKDQMDPDNGMFLCPSDRVQIATPYYPRHKGSGNNGLKGSGNPDNPVTGTNDMAYWGLLSYGVNEDVTGAEVAESNGKPACWRAAFLDDGTTRPCLGEFNYPSGPCAGSKGWRLRGQLDKVYQPAQVGLIFETGRDEENQSVTGLANLVISAGGPQNAGPYLWNFQLVHSARMPNARHPKQAINVLFADGHGEKTTPVEFDEDPSSKTFGLPTLYAPVVRVSPYTPGTKVR